MGTGAGHRIGSSGDERSPRSTVVEITLTGTGFRSGRDFGKSLLGGWVTEQIWADPISTRTVENPVEIGRHQVGFIQKLAQNSDLQHFGASLVDPDPV